MCSRVKCYQCGKASWSGCGAHVEMVLRGVPEEERCKCRQSQQSSSTVPSFQDIWAQLMNQARREEK